MGIISFILNATKLLTALTGLVEVVKKNKAVTIVVGLCLFMIVGSSYFLIKNYSNNTPYRNAIAYDEYVNYIDGILNECGDKIAISIGVVNTDLISTEDFWRGRFEIARACDDRFLEKDGSCIINLKDRQPGLYNINHEVRVGSYNFLTSLGEMTLPAYFHLRDDEGQQNLDSVSFYPSIKKILEKSDWHKEGLLEDLRVTAIISNNKKLLYVVTFVSAKPFSEMSCFNSDTILINLRDFIIKNRRPY